MNSIKILYRNLEQKKFLTSMRIIGLVIGVSVSLYIFEFNSWEKSYDLFWNGGEQVFRVTLKHHENGKLITHSARNFLGVPQFLKMEIPGIKEACGFNRDVINIFCEEQQFNEVDWLWCDTSIFDVLDRPIVLAENDEYWNDLHAAIISESFAKKLYGDKNPINQRFTLNEGWEYHVKAVFEDIPTNSHLNVDVVASRASLTYHMRNFNNATRQMVENPNFQYNGINPYEQWAWNTPIAFRRFSYIRLKEGVDIEQVKNAIPEALKKINMTGRYAGSQLEFEFQPVSSIHLNSNLEHEYKANGSKSRVGFLYLIACIVLLVSAFNFLNLTNIQTIENGKKYAIHILNGAKLKSIIWMLLLDNLVVIFISGALGLIIIFGLRNVLLKEQLIHSENILIITTILFITALTGVIIPYLSTLKGRLHSYIKTQSGSLPGTWRGRKTLVITQFTIAIILIAGTILIRKQMHFMSNTRLGFEPKQTMFSFSPMSMNHHPEIKQRLTSFRDEVLKVPGVEFFAVSSSVPGRAIKRHSDNVRTNEVGEALSTNFSQISVSDDFIKLFKLELISGQNFRPQTHWQSDEVIINETALKELGFSSAQASIGKSIRVGNNQKNIVGVIRDYHHVSLKSTIMPLIIEQNLNWEYAVGFYTIRFDTKRTQEILEQVTEIWERIYPIEVASFHFTDQVFDSQYVAEKTFKSIITYGSILALLISCIGLFAIASFDTQKRIKEIGVRKVNGASIFDVMKMLNMDFLKWVMLGFILAIPLAYYAMYKWLESFAYKTELSWWIFALSGIMAFCIALLTISWKSWQAARKNPVEALRYE